MFWRHSLLVSTIICFYGLSSFSMDTSLSSFEELKLKEIKKQIENVKSSADLRTIDKAINEIQNPKIKRG